MTDEIITLQALLVKSYLLNVMHVRTAPALWKHLQNDDAVPIKIENAFQSSEGWIELPAAQSPIVC